MRDEYPSEAPNYTKACVVMFGVNITWIFTVIWAIWGLLFVMMLGLVINHAMTRIHAWSQARAARDLEVPRAKLRPSTRLRQDFRSGL